MKAVIARTEAALAERQNAESALQTARGALRQAEQELAEAQDKLAVAEAGAAVGGGDVDKNARKRLLAARDESDFARARVTGLEQHLRATTAVTTEAQRDLARGFAIGSASRRRPSSWRCTRPPSMRCSTPCACWYRRNSRLLCPVSRLMILSAKPAEVRVEAVKWLRS